MKKTLVIHGEEAARKTFFDLMDWAEATWGKGEGIDGNGASFREGDAITAMEKFNKAMDDEDFPTFARVDIAGLSPFGSAFWTFTWRGQFTEGRCIGYVYAPLSIISEEEHSFGVLYVSTGTGRPSKFLASSPVAEHIPEVCAMGEDLTQHAE